jgi:hypothetical protein
VKYETEYRDAALVKGVIEEIRRTVTRLPRRLIKFF